MTVKAQVPLTIQIGGKDYRIIVVPKGELALTSGLKGLANFNDQTLKLEWGSHIEGRNETFCHEWQEAVNSVWLAERMTHDDIERMGEALWQFLKGLGIELDWSLHEKGGQSENPSTG